jgi:hypothetical protein
MERKQVHITLQGKGGIGKSYITSIVAQYLLDQGEEVMCIDTDPINSTLASFEALNAQKIVLMEENRIKEGHFDAMMEQILSTDAHFVIDSGASSFVPLSNYLLQHEAIELMAEHGKQPIIHIIIAGGFALINTMTDFAHLAGQLPEEAQIVLWLNEHFGPIEFEGRGFEQSKAYTTHIDRIQTIIRLPRQPIDTFGNTLEQLISQRLTFTEALNSNHFHIMPKQRITLYRRALYDQLTNVG